MAFPRPVIITANKGSDIDADIQFTDEDDNPFELLNWTVSAYDVSPELTTPTNLVTVNVSDQAEGQVSVRIEWDERLETGVGYQFRLQLVQGADNFATNIIGVLYQ